jgi:hypothetical protein
VKERMIPQKAFRTDRTSVSMYCFPGGFLRGAG